jgi:flagellar basal-body rod protein FlgG
VFQVAPLPVLIGPVAWPGNLQPVVASLDPLQGRQSVQNQLFMVQTDFSQGVVRPTGHSLDFALEGEGFFVVEGPQGETYYTRQGTFSLNAAGVLVTPNGLPVQGESGPLRVRSGRLEVDATGRVLVDGQVLDRLKLVNFPQPYPLEKAGETLFRATVPNPAEQDATGVVVHQGALELSNAQPMRLLADVLLTSRAYEAYQKVIQAFDATAARTVNDIANTR